MAVKTTLVNKQPKVEPTFAERLAAAVADVLNWREDRDANTVQRETLTLAESFGAPSDEQRTQAETFLSNDERLKDAKNRSVRDLLLNAVWLAGRQAEADARFEAIVNANDVSIPETASFVRFVDMARRGKTDDEIKAKLRQLADAEKAHNAVVAALAQLRKHLPAMLADPIDARFAGDDGKEARQDARDWLTASEEHFAGLEKVTR